MKLIDESLATYIIRQTNLPLHDYADLVINNKKTKTKI